MGRYEDLLAQARAGDEEAFELLEQEFGVSTLRDKASEADSLRDQLSRAMPMMRKVRLDELVSKMPDDLQAVTLDVGDFGEFNPDDLTLETVQDKARAKLESTQATKLSQATEHGFDSVEEYEEALETAKQAKAQRREGMETIGGGVASSGGEPAGGVEPSNREVGKTAWDQSQKAGESTDISLSRSVAAILEAEATRMAAEE